MCVAVAVASFDVAAAAWLSQAIAHAEANWERLKVLSRTADLQGSKNR